MTLPSEMCDDCESNGYRIAPTLGQFKSTMGDQVIVRCDTCRRLPGDIEAKIQFARGLETAQSYACELSEQLIQAAREHQSKVCKY